MYGSRPRPRQFFRGIELYKWREPMMIVQHGCADIDEKVEALRICKHPVFAARTIELAMRSMQTADDRFASCDGEALAGHRHAEGVGASAEPLAASAMASHRQQRRRAYPKTNLAAHASTLPRQLPITHGQILHLQLENVASRGS